MRRYEDHERPLPPEAPAACYDCRLRYDDPGWVDVLVPNDVWEVINPTRHPGAGLLCFTCIARRLVEAGLSSVLVQIRSGPFVLAWERRRP